MKKRKFNPGNMAVRLKTVRKQNNLLRTQMAEALDVCVNGYRKCERGENGLSQQSQIILAEKFDISLNWLLLDKGPMHLTDIEKALLENVQLKQEIRRQEQMGKNGNAGSDKLPKMVEVTTPEVRELLEFMEANPLFKFQLLTHFYRFKQEGQAPQELPLPGYKKKGSKRNFQE